MIQPAMRTHPGESGPREMTTTLQSSTDHAALRDAANQHLCVGMNNAAQLAEEGGPLVMESA